MFARTTLFLCLIATTGVAQQQQLVTRTGAVKLQSPKIATIEFFGLHKTSEAKVRQALGVKEGDFLPRSKAEAEDRIDHIPGIVEAHLEGVCCEDGNLTLFVGVEEKGATHFDLREPPDGDSALPEDVVKVYKNLLAATAKIGALHHGGRSDAGARAFRGSRHARSAGAVPAGGEAVSQRNPPRAARFVRR